MTSCIARRAKHSRLVQTNHYSTCFVCYEESHFSNNEKIDSIKQCNDSMGVVYFELARVMHKINFVTERLAQLLEGKPLSPAPKACAV